MMSRLDTKTKALALVFVVTLGVALLQRTPLAFLPRSINDFLLGFAVGMGIVLVVAVAAVRAEKPTL